MFLLRGDGTVVRRFFEPVLNLRIQSKFVQYFFSRKIVCLRFELSLPFSKPKVTEAPHLYEQCRIHLYYKI